MDEKAPWRLVLEVAVLPLAGATWAVLQWWITRGDTRRRDTQTATDKREERLASENRVLYENIKGQLNECRRDLDQRDDQLDRMRDVARRWQDIAREERAQRRQDRQLAQSFVQRAERHYAEAYNTIADPPFAWTEMNPLPDKLEGQ